MVNIQSPLVNLSPDADTATYIGTLERQLVLLVLRDVKFRALLELLTDQTWDDVAVDRFDNDQLVSVATAGVAMRLGISVEEAGAMVETRWNTHNKAPAIYTPETKPLPTAKELFEQWQARRAAATANTGDSTAESPS